MGLSIVGVLMVGSIRRIEFDDLTELVPSFVTIIMMLFTYNIGNGLTAGLLVYPLIKLAGGRRRSRAIVGSSDKLPIAFAAIAR